MDQRTCIKFCVKNEIKCADAFRMLTVAYGKATLNRSNVYRWYKMFSEGREDVNDEERAGRPTTSKTDEKIDKVQKMVLANRRITVREVAEDLDISIGSCHSIFKILKDSEKLKIEKRSVPLNIKPYICGVCNKSFLQKYTLKNHEQSHKGKPFLCNMCAKLFAKDISLQRHIQRCHFESKYKCDKCEKSLSSKLKLTVHMKDCNLADDLATYLHQSYLNRLH